jgi:N-acetyl-gamma-glutamyl-phosphate/LysW-gamma-L-alpha-aminoadipyl-6-phosphate reductase
MDIGIIGGSGYAGGELLRLFLNHPKADIKVVTSRRFSGEFIHMIHPNLRGFSDHKFSNFNIDNVSSECELLFLATPHGTSKDFVPTLLSSGVKIIDLSADFRLKNPSDYPIWYGWDHPSPELLDNAVYGLPELHREEIKDANLVACPGCMAHASILALAPIIKSGFIEDDKIILDAKIGSSGGGSEPTPVGHHPERFGGLRPYQTVGHRHTAEIEQELGLLKGSSVKVGLTPHAMNVARGILVTCHLWLRNELRDRDLWRAYRSFYGNEPFVRIVKYRKGIYQLPDPKVVVGTNFCDIGFMLDNHVERLVVLSAIDNIVKGAAGQAVQCFNILHGIDEKMGLDLIGLH